jgi:ubiquinone/menaquinone biosynthesis C-methylase UbiE
MQHRDGAAPRGVSDRGCCSMALMGTDIDPAGVEPGAILQAVDFRDARVLEVGAGNGRLTFRYADEPRSVVGIDPKEADILSAAKVPRAGLRGQARFLCAGATALPFSAEAFDIVLLASSL